MSSAAARRRRGLKQVSALRKTFRNAAKEDSLLVVDVRKAIREAAEYTAEVMRFKAPIDEGDLVRSITYITSRDGFSATVGPGVKRAEYARKKTGSIFNTAVARSTGKRINFSAQTNHDRFQMIKAYWLELGTKKMGARPFVDPTRVAVKDDVRLMVSRATKSALNRLFTRGWR